METCCPSVTFQPTAAINSGIVWPRKTPNRLLITFGCFSDYLFKANLYMSADSMSPVYYRQWEGMGPNAYSGTVTPYFTGLRDVYKSFIVTVEIFVAHFSGYDRVTT